VEEDLGRHYKKQLEEHVHIWTALGDKTEDPNKKNIKKEGGGIRTDSQENLRMDLISEGQIQEAGAL